MQVNDLILELRDNQLLTLNQIKINTAARVEKVVGDSLAAKLADMGLTPGQEVSVLYRAPLGDPLAVQVGNYVLSLRKKEAALIKITTEESTN